MDHTRSSVPFCARRPTLLRSAAMTTLRQKLLLLLAICALVPACGSDNEGPADPAEGECEAGLTFDPIRKDCVRLSSGPIDDGPVAEQDAGDVDEADGGGEGEPDAQVELDAGMDAGDVAAPDLGCQTDEDGDGFIAMTCGGDDCDDQNPLRRPDSGELCDEVDNDCDGAVNEELDCSFYAHTPTRLYRLDVFTGASTDLGPVPDLNDIDTAPDGTLYGITFEYLHIFDPATGLWTRRAQPLSLTDSANGFCIDNAGKAYITTFSALRVVNLETGASSRVGSIAPEVSSGDCVVNKGNVLFMTSSRTTPDSLVRLDGTTGSATPVGLTGHDAIWGLTAAWGRLFGTTSGGAVVEIDETTGQTVQVATYPGLSFYGAASTPAR